LFTNKAEPVDALVRDHESCSIIQKYFLKHIEERKEIGSSFDSKSEDYKFNNRESSVKRLELTGKGTNTYQVYILFIAIAN
jgi:hypothetical protein